MRQYTPAQLAQINRWIKRGTTQTRCSMSELAKRVGVPLSTLRGEITRRSTKQCTRAKRPGTHKIVGAYVQLREARARAGDHTKVKAVDVSGKLQAEMGTGRRMKSAATMARATRKKPHLRDPVESVQHGHMAKSSQQDAYYLNHSR